MAEAIDDDDEVFVYMGGDQQVPDGVRRARIHKDVKIVHARAFYHRRQLISVEFHDGIEIIEEYAFYCCPSLRSIKLLGIKIIKADAFKDCSGLLDVEFGDKLETIEEFAFNNCSSLKKIRMPSVRTVGGAAFAWCYNLADVECDKELRTLHVAAFRNCPKLKRIALPLKDDMIEDNVFFDCPNLTTIDLVGETRRTIASLHLESWRNEMNNEINRMNQTLPFTNHKTEEIRQRMRSTFRQLNHFKAEHNKILKEATTLLELSLWKVNLDNNEGDRLKREGVRTVREVESSRDEIRYTCGADIVIKNVLPFLALKF